MSQADPDIVEIGIWYSEIEAAVAGLGKVARHLVLNILPCGVLERKRAVDVDLVFFFGSIIHCAAEETW